MDMKDKLLSEPSNTDDTQPSSSTTTSRVPRHHQPPPKKPSLSNARKTPLLATSYATLFVRYLTSQQLAGFFTAVADDHGVAPEWVGAIFMAYPLGMALTSLLAPALVRRLGTRNALTIGVLATASCNLLFGFAPDLVGYRFDSPAADSAAAPASLAGSLSAPLPPPPPAEKLLLLEITFCLVYFLNGLVGALAETSCVILLSLRFTDTLGTVMAHVNTFSTCGCLAGTFLGGLLYDAAGTDRAMAFRLPFLVTTVFILLLLPTRYAIPDERLHVAHDAPSAPLRSALSKSVVLGLSAVGLSAAVLGTLDTDLPYRLQAPPFWLTMTQLSTATAVSSAGYLVLMVPVASAAGRLARSSRLLKLATGCGFVVCALSFALLGPMMGLERLNTFGFVVAALILRAVGSATSSNFVYPDLVHGISEEDAPMQATIATLWNAAYALGWAAGPFVGGALYDAFKGERELCLILERDACRDGAPYGPSGCLCEWTPSNGFVGFSNVTAIFCLAFGALHFVAAACDVHDLPPETRDPSEPPKPHDDGSESSLASGALDGVVPLVIASGES